MIPAFPHEISFREDGSTYFSGHLFIQTKATPIIRAIRANAAKRYELWWEDRYTSYIGKRRRQGDIRGFKVICPHCLERNVVDFNSKYIWCESCQRLLASEDNDVSKNLRDFKAGKYSCLLHEYDFTGIPDAVKMGLAKNNITIDRIKKFCERTI